MVDTIMLVLLAMLVGAYCLDMAYRFRRLIPPDPMPQRGQGHGQHHEGGRHKHRHHGGAPGAPPYSGGNGNGGQQPQNGGQSQEQRRVFP